MPVTGPPYTSLFNVVWTIAVVELWVRMFVAMIKVFVLAVPQKYMGEKRGAGGDTSAVLGTAGDVLPDRLAIRRKKNACAMIEIVSLLYRALIPLPLWRIYCLAAGDGFEYFWWFYIGCKALVVVFRLRLIWLGLTMGDEVNRLSWLKEAPEAGTPDCGICYENPMIRPVQLPCKHIFCTACTIEWLEKQSTCPVCRAACPLAENPLPLHFREGTSSLYPIIF